MTERLARLTSAAENPLVRLRLSGESYGAAEKLRQQLADLLRPMFLGIMFGIGEASQFDMGVRRRQIFGSFKLQPGIAQTPDQQCRRLPALPARCDRVMVGLSCRFCTVATSDRPVADVCRNGRR